MIEIMKGKVVPEKVGEADIFSQVYNPDVLLCLANLSNDEVFTPPEVANQMLDMLPQELFEDPNTKFLDPACKSGVFLREIAKRLIKGLEDKIPDLQERIDHICKEQLYGIAITELTSLLSRRSVYCSKYPNGPFSIAHFDNVEGNIRFKNCKHEWEGERNLWTFVHGEKVRVWRKCKYCGAPEEQFGEENRKELEYHAYEFIHTLSPEDIFNMKFDVVISNVPYQMETGGGQEGTRAATQARPIYHLFIEQAKKLNPRYLSMIIPARWYSGGIGLNAFRENMLNDKRLTKLVDFINSKDCFSGVNVAGGICYFLWERDHVEDDGCLVTNISGDNKNTMSRPLNEFGNMFIRSNEAISIIYKVRAKCSEFWASEVSAIDTFGIPSKEKGHKEQRAGDIRLLHSVGSNSQGIDFIDPSIVKKNRDLIDKYKIKISIMVPQNGEVGINPENGYRSISTPQILPPGTVDTFSYLNIGFFDTENEALNFQKFMNCKFPRFLMRTTYSSVHVSKNNFVFVPKMDFTKEWTDKKLYEYFNLDKNEIDLIEKTMRPMQEEGDD